jgi:hypothetical protein
MSATHANTPQFSPGYASDNNAPFNKATTHLKKFIFTTPTIEIILGIGNPQLAFLPFVGSILAEIVKFQKNHLFSLDAACLIRFPSPPTKQIYRHVTYLQH